MRIEMRLEGVEESLEQLGSSLDAEMHEFARAAGEIVARQAQLDHPYTDRTGDLTASIQGDPPSGRFMLGDLEAHVFAGAEYAEYVDEKPAFEFLEPASDAAQSILDEEAQNALDRAAHAAGW